MTIACLVSHSDSKGNPAPCPGYPHTSYPPSWDRIYPRCPVCRSEQYALNVLYFSAGKCGCWSCGHVIREDARYVDKDDS